MWDQGSQPQDQGSQAMGSRSGDYEGSWIGLYHFCWVREQNLSTFGIKVPNQKFGYKNGIIDEKKNTRPWKTHHSTEGATTVCTCKCKCKCNLQKCQVWCLTTSLSCDHLLIMATLGPNKSICSHFIVYNIP